MSVYLFLKATRSVERGGRMMATAKIVLWRIVGIDLVNAESRLEASLRDGVNPLATYKENITNK